MPTKTKIFLPSILLTLTVIYLYFNFKIGDLEKKTFQNLQRTTQRINQLYTDLKNITPSNLLSYLEAVKKDYPNVSLVAIADKNFVLKSVTKNNKKELEESTYQNLLKDLTQGKFKPEYLIKNNNKIFTRYYPPNQENKKKYYITAKKTKNDDLILVVYPYQANKKLLLKTSLEIFLIVLVAIIIVTFIYLKIFKLPFLTKITEKDQSKLRNENKSRQLNLSKKTITEEKSIISHKTSSIATESLNDYVFSLFKKIHSNYKPDLISLYLRNNPQKLTKSYELKGKSFIKIESDNFASLNIHPDLEKTILANQDTQLKLPINFNKALIGVIEIISKTSFDTDQIKAIKAELESTAKYINNFLVIDDVFIDKESGLYSQIYFELKYNEQLRLAQKDGRLFSLIFMSLFPKTDQEILPTEKNTIIKLISPTIAEILKEDDYLCLYEDHLAIILPNVKDDENLAIANSLKESLSKYKIKIKEGKTFQLKPVFGLSSSSLIEDKSQILSTASQNLKLALKK